MSAIYLSKDGQSFGPFTEAQIEEMRVRGDIKRDGYEWIWHEGGIQWEPIDRAPVPPPPPGAGTPITRHETVSDQQGQTSRLLRIPDEAAQKLQAICYDQVNVLTGNIRKAGESGCDFVARSHGAAPVFMKDMPVRLNLLDARSGMTMSVHATVSQAVRQEGQWNYRLSWENCPELLLKVAA